MTANNTRIRRALISVSDKTNIIDFARELANLDIQLISTGGTARLLRENNILVSDVSDITGFPEIMDGRVKTLHPKIHGGLLNRPGIDDAVLAELNIEPIDLVIVNLYPFQQVIQDPNCDLAHAIENIDIGGPTMLRASAKNHVRVSVVSDPTDYPDVLKTLQENEGSIPADMRFNLAKKTFAHTAQYDLAISQYLSQQDATDTFHCDFNKKLDLRYGENPHQKATFYVEANPASGTISGATQIQGKALSFNNIADSDAALECAKEFTEQTACVIVKHANPCGVALSDTPLAAYQRAFATDPTSSFGGIIAFNTLVDVATAQAIIDQQFVEVIIAPKFDDAALDCLKTKPNVRVLCCGAIEKPEPDLNYKKVSGGLLVQDCDQIQVQENDLKTVSQRTASEQEIQDCLFAWKVAKHVKSNAIVYAKDQATIGIGAGQMSRIVSAKIAGIKAEDAELTVAGSVMASDAFFPFRDGIDAAASVGITAVIQPGGSIRDEEVIAAADENKMAMLLTNIRHFRH